jgi:hypothetical protein
MLTVAYDFVGRADLIDAQGRAVRSDEAASWAAGVDVSSLPSGLYFWRVEKGNAQAVPVVIAH